MTPLTSGTPSRTCVEDRGTPSARRSRTACSAALRRLRLSTPEERTRILAGATGQDITFVEHTEDGERARLRGYGYDDDYVEFVIQLATNPPDVAGVVLPTVENVTGRPARTFALWAQENADRFRSAPRRSGRRSEVSARTTR